MRWQRSRIAEAAPDGLQVDPIEVIWYLDDDTPPAPLDYAVEHCACGADHLEPPRDAAGRELVCREHKRHLPCKPCERRRAQGWWDGHV